MEIRSTVFSPIRCELLLHFFYSPLPYENEIGMQEDLIDFVAKGVLMRVQESVHFKLTDMGRKWVEMVLETPLPVLMWVDPRKLEVNAQ